MTPERFAIVPRSFTDALRMRDISSDEFVGVVLIDEARGEGVVRCTLVTLRELLGWECDTETVRRRVRALEAGGWIKCEAKPGTAGWVIALTEFLGNSSSEAPLARNSDSSSSSSSTDAVHSPEAVPETAQLPLESSSPTSSLARAGRDETIRSGRGAHTRAWERSSEGADAREAAAQGGPSERKDGAKAAELVAVLAPLSALPGTPPTPKQFTALLRARAVDERGFDAQVAKLAKDEAGVHSWVAVLTARVGSLNAKSERLPVCPECEMSPPHHAADCSLAGSAT